MTTPKKEQEHKDKLGRQITVGSKVAVSRRNALRLCSVVKVHPIMLSVSPVNANGEFLVYPSDSIVIDGPDLLAYVLKGNRG
jgi:hypothetical protein